MVDPLEWHRKALAGENPPIHEENIGDVHAGWYVRRFGDRYTAPLFPAIIFWEGEHDPETGELLGDEVLRCEILGERYDPLVEWPMLCVRPISEAEYNSLQAELFSAETYRGPQRTRVRWLTDKG